MQFMTSLTVWREGDCPLHRREISRMSSLDRRRSGLWHAIQILRSAGQAAGMPWLLRLLRCSYLCFLRVRPFLQQRAGGLRR
jgi:hypothetical protein